MELSQAKEIAIKYWTEMKPLCRKIKVAGSVRREKPEVHDIEIVCLPHIVKHESPGLFESEEIWEPVPEFVNYVNAFPRLRGAGTGRYAQLVLPEKINLDLFITNEDNFGLMLMIRTGSAEFSKRMVNVIKRQGFYCAGGYLFDSKNNLVPVKDERDFFTITGFPFVEPRERIM